MSTWVKSWLAITLMILVTGGLDLSARGENAVPITLVNYSRLPVHATAVTLDAAELSGKLGLAAGAPLQVKRKDGSPVPLSRGIENGRRVIWLYVSLAPESRLDLVAEPAARWSEAGVAVAQSDASTGTALLANGILEMAFSPKGWDLAFAGPGGIETKIKQKAQVKSDLITNGLLDFWIDTRNRGRIMNSNPRDFGLAHYADSKMIDCKASISAEGRPTLIIRRRMDGVAQAMTVIETFELVPGSPILACRIRWQNDGDSPLWVAYVSSGDGIKGRWAKPLMAVPLIERKKSPLLGDLNGAETRPSWLPQLCRISMEAPATGCGVGMSTLLPMPNKVGTGSMVWGCGASGFQCNFIDPVQGQFPFQVKPHGALENGFAFLATQAGASVYRQTVELWTALQKEKIPALDPPCAVFIGRAPQCAQTVTGLGGGMTPLSTDGAVSRAALKLDFNKSFQLQAGIESATPREPVEISARPLISGKPAVTLLRATAPGLATIDLNAKLGWKKDEVPVILEVRTQGQSSIKTLSIAETLPTAPEPLSPIPDASFTDLATMFRWKPIPMVVDYDLEWSRAADFTSSTQIRVTDSRDTLWYLPTDAQLPVPGVWYWRVRGVKGEVLGTWSQPRRFTVNNDHSARPLKRPLTAGRPLFTLEASKVTDFTNFHPDVPADIAPYIGIIAEGFEGKGLTVTDFARGLDKIPHSIMLRSHWVGLADIEWLFQSVPNFIGIQGGEHLSDLYSDGKDGAMRYAHRLTRLCAKYGMLYQEADGTYKDDKWQDLMDRQGDFVRQYGRYLVLSQKNNIIRRQFYSQSAALGLWLGGLTHQHGAWEDGGFYWQNAGFGELDQCTGERSGVLKTMPRIFWDLVFVMGISRGCGMYSLDGQTLMVSPKEIERQVAGLPRAAIWDTTGKTTDVFKRYVVPLIRGAVRHGLIPTREQVLRNVRLAVYNDMKGRGDLKAWPYYVEYGPLYAATYGFRKMGAIDGQLWEFFPNTGRYFYIPVLIQGNEPLGPEIKNLPVSQLQDPARVKQIFDAAYPKWYEGDALACRVGDTLTVLNSRENEDVTESYAVPLECGAIRAVSGKIGPHAYLVGKIEDQGRRLWLQSNTEYPERDTTLKFSCTSKPEWSVEPAGAAKAATWDEMSKTLELRLSHRQGAVEVTLK